MSLPQQSNERTRAKPQTAAQFRGDFSPTVLDALHIPIAEKLSGLRQVRDAVRIESHEPRAGEVGRHRIMDITSLASQIFKSPITMQDLRRGVPVGPRMMRMTTGEDRKELAAAIPFLGLKLYCYAVS